MPGGTGAHDALRCRHVNAGSRPKLQVGRPPDLRRDTEQLIGIDLAVGHRPRLVQSRGRPRQSDRRRVEQGAARPAYLEFARCIQRQRWHPQLNDVGDDKPCLIDTQNQKGGLTIPPNITLPGQHCPAGLAACRRSEACSQISSRRSGPCRRRASPPPSRAACSRRSALGRRAASPLVCREACSRRSRLCRRPSRPMYPAACSHRSERGRRAASRSPCLARAAADRNPAAGRCHAHLAWRRAAAHRNAAANGITPTVPGGVQPPIGTLPPTGITPTVPGGVQRPIGRCRQPASRRPCLAACSRRSGRCRQQASCQPSRRRAAAHSNPAAGWCHAHLAGRRAAADRNAPAGPRHTRTRRRVASEVGERPPSGRGRRSIASILAIRERYVAAANRRFHPARYRLPRNCRGRRQRISTEPSRSRPGAISAWTNYWNAWTETYAARSPTAASAST